MSGRFYYKTQIWIRLLIHCSLCERHESFLNKVNTIFLKFYVLFYFIYKGKRLRFQFSKQPNFSSCSVLYRKRPDARSFAPLLTRLSPKHQPGKKINKASTPNVRKLLFLSPFVVLYALAQQIWKLLAILYDKNLNTGRFCFFCASFTSGRIWKF